MVCRSRIAISSVELFIIHWSCVTSTCESFVLDGSMNSIAKGRPGDVKNIE